MKRSTIALALCVGLSACSGQNNKDTSRGLGSGDRDAAEDAAEGEPTDDAETPTEEDASEPAIDAGAAEDSGDGQDGGDPSDAGLDAGSDAGGGDAGGGDGTKLTVKIPLRGLFAGGPLPLPGFRPSVLFSHADGGVESVRETDDAGVVVSETAPAMVTAVMSSQRNNLESRTVIVTVLAPALGDTIELSEPAGPMPEEQRATAYQLNTSGLPSDWYSIEAFAGRDACANGYLSVDPAPTGPVEIHRYAHCELEMPGTLLALVRDIDDTLLRFGAVTLPSAGTLPATVSIDQWVAPETVTLSLSGTQPNNAAQAWVLLRKGLLRSPADALEPSEPNQFPFLVARSLVDSFDTAIRFERTENEGTPTAHPQQHLIRKNRPANESSYAFDGAERLPAAASMTPQLTPLLRPSASWTVEGGSTSADAVLVGFTWSWFEGDSSTNVRWYIIGPADTLSVQIPERPPETAYWPEWEPPSPQNTRFLGVEYYDSDRQDGYRAFLKETIRQHDEFGWDETSGFSLVRDLAVGATLRVSDTYPIQN